MATYLEIVQVTYACHLKGERVPYGLIDEYPISNPPSDEMPEPEAYFNLWGERIEASPEKPISDYLSVRIDMPCDWYGLDFSFVGESFDPCYTGGIAHECENSGADQVFEEWKTDLAKIGEQLLRKHNEDHPKADEKADVVNFLTLWEYTEEEGREYGDWYFDWQLLGVLDPSKLRLALKDAPTLGAT